MKKVIVSVVFVILLLSGCGCRGVVLDENETVLNNGTQSLVKNEVEYSISDGKICADGDVLYEVENTIEDKIFALGEYLYVNTTDGVVQMKIDGTMKKNTWSGKVVAAKGRWMYYQSDNNKQETMTLYKIDMKEGAQLLLFADTMVEVKEIENDVFYFRGKSGNEYINALGSDEGMFFEDWINEEETK